MSSALCRLLTIALNYTLAVWLRTGPTRFGSNISVIADYKLLSA